MRSVRGRGPGHPRPLHPETPGDSLVFNTRRWYTFRGHWDAALPAAGLEDFRFHDLRNTFASWAIQWGATLPELKDPHDTAPWRCNASM
jgi:integrase